MDETTELIRCFGCGAERPRSEMVQGKIIYRAQGWTPRGKWGQVVKEMTQWFCADKPCRGNCQMGYEG